MALGGVATGSMKAQLAARATGTVSVTGLTPSSMREGGEHRQQGGGGGQVAGELRQENHQDHGADHDRRDSKGAQRHQGSPQPVGQAGF